MVQYTLYLDLGHDGGRYWVDVHEDNLHFAQG